MAIEGTKALKTVRNEAQAQELINEGWLLLGLFDRQDGTDQYVEYHLGFPKKPRKVKPVYFCQNGCDRMAKVEFQ
ncbi:hypothetical protein B6D87_23755 (plasmid) [Pseudomonas fragi]|uniref:hypothetical protein n=1 Tax=Pseudomonas fragi TaxID=296 RepID=UPI000A2A3A15|nr:hypothetical protein [Pseudomonas fragi]ARQ77181.1 hypothetical protein B6D87_23755 [Pseudomonas fragi]